MGFLSFHNQQLHQKILQSCQPAVFSHDPFDHGGYIHWNLTNGHLSHLFKRSLKNEAMITKRPPLKANNKKK